MRSKGLLLCSALTASAAASIGRGGYAQRKVLYNWYHVLNHMKLFGSGYAEQATEQAKRIMASPLA